MREENSTPPAGAERMASPWLGVACGESASERQPRSALDLIANAWLAKMTANISPVAVSNAYMDWWSHLQLSPSRQQALLTKSVRKFWRWQEYALRAALPGGPAPAPCVVPLPQDKRFDAPAWQRWPYNVIAQGFLLNQQWWHRATTGVHGVSQHHEDVVTFSARQWLDMLAPSNFLLTNPVVQDATLRSGGVNLLRGMENACADLRESRSGAQPGPRAGAGLAVTPGKVVFRNRLIELIEYTPSTPSVRAVPVLIVPAWIMKYYILDLSPGNSLVQYLVDEGFTVFMISWKNPDAGDRDLTMDDYRTLGVMAALAQVGDITGAPRVHGVGYCLGGTLLAIAAATMAREHDARLAGVTLFASQVDFKEPGELSLFIDESEISYLEATMWDQGYLDTKQMAGAFQLLRSNDLIWSRRLNEYLLGIPEARTDLMTWNADATRMPYRMHTDYLTQLFLHNDLAEGRYCSGGRTVALTDIGAPVFAVGTLTDHVAPWRSVFKIHRLTDTEVTFLLTSGGHNAGVVSPPGHAHRSYQVLTHAQDAPGIDADSWQAGVPVQDGSWWPAWVDWLTPRCGALVAPPPMPSALCDAPGEYVLQR